MSNEQVTVNAAWLAELGREIAELKATNVVLVEALKYVRDWARSTSPVLLSEVAERALKKQGGGE